MHHEGRIIRPPSERESILLQVTLGCSHNRCTFCPIYKTRPFRVKDERLVAEDIACAARHLPERRRVFLCDGDVLVLSQRRLLALLQRIRAGLPQVRQVSTYGSAKAIATKSDAELRALRGLGLRIVHVGLESGDDATLQRVQKHGDSQFIVEQARRARAAGMKTFVSVLLGLGGRARSRRHAVATAQALNGIQPEYVGALSLMVVPGTPLHDELQRGEFAELSPLERVQELHTLVAHTELERTLFFANHASNHLPVQAVLGAEKDDVLALMERALAGEIALRPESLRGL